ncbi:MAG: caspase family protein [Neomegalonema sp.]|nr:caspase family protein [Neomegalonema sp.]
MKSIVRVMMGITLALALDAAGANALARSVALVIGNAGYKHAAMLRNPLNDADDVAKALKALGFEVTLKKDLPRNGLNDAIDRFGDASAGADIAVLYFAGHGVEVDGQNYLVPVDAKLTHVRHVRARTTSLRTAVDAVSGAKFRLLIIDACRDNPLTRGMRTGSRSVGRGLARMEPTESNMMIAFAAAAGALASDGRGRNSPYARALIQALREPRREVRFLFGRVRDLTIARTRGDQRPHMYASLGAQRIYLHPVRSTPADPPRGVAARRILGPAPTGLSAAVAGLWARAQEGDARAIAALGFVFETGAGGLKRDLKRALRLYRHAAAQGDALGQSNLGAMYGRGVGELKRDEKEAVRLYRLAAAQGYALAQVNLGMMHRLGRGGLRKDEKEAARLFRLAADQGEAWGFAALAELHERGGGGLKKSRATAIRLYRRAAEQGLDYAQKALKRLGAE